MAISSSWWMATAGGESETIISGDNTNWAGDTGNWTWGDDNRLASSDETLGGNVRTAVYYSVDITGPFYIKYKAHNYDMNVVGGIAAIYPTSEQASIGTSGNTWGMGMFSDSSNHWASGDPDGKDAIGMTFNGSSSTPYTGLDPKYQNLTNVSVTRSVNHIHALRRAANGTMTYELDINDGNGFVVKFTGDQTETAAMRFAIGSAAEDQSIEMEYIAIVQ